MNFGFTNPDEEWRTDSRRKVMSLVLDILSSRWLWYIQEEMSTGDFFFLIYEFRAPRRCQGGRLKFGKHQHMDDSKNHQSG